MTALLNYQTFLLLVRQSAEEHQQLIDCVFDEKHKSPVSIIYMYHQ